MTAGALRAPGAVCGIVGPAVFTGAWVVSSLRQTGHPAAELQISGLAAPDARDPWLMMAGFVLLGGCTVAFGTALREALGHAAGAGGPGRPGLAPRLIQCAGLLTIAAGLLRRDHMLLTPGAVSWHNHAHDVVSAVIYVDLVAAQVLLAQRFGRDQGTPGAAGRPWAGWRPWLLASSAATGAALIAFAADTSAPQAGVLQRVAVTIPLAAIAAVAIRLLRLPARPGER